MDNVALVRCADYGREAVGQAVDRVFTLCGGIERFVQPGMRVLIKLNLLMKRTPDRATTTHPEVARAVALAVQRAGGVPVFADSPGGPFTRGMLAGVYETCGIRAVAQELGCALNDDFSVTARAFPEGDVAKRLDLIGVLEHVDAVITVGKLKTHGLTTMTGCVKNLYGCVPGTTKVEYHARYPQAELFSRMLIDLCACVKPCFALLDAVEGMEGEGPSGGRPRTIGALVGGENPQQVDAVGAALIGLAPEDVATLRAAKLRGLLKPFDCVGDPMEPLVLHDFDIPMRTKRRGWVNMVDRLPQALRPRPVFTHRACDGCGTCMRACPAKAISMDGQRRPQVDLRKCIRCYCCQELCPKTDVEVSRSPILCWLHEKGR